MSFQKKWRLYDQRWLKKPQGGPALICTPSTTMPLYTRKLVHTHTLERNKTKECGSIEASNTPIDAHTRKAIQRTKGQLERDIHLQNCSTSSPSSCHLHVLFNTHVHLFRKCTSFYTRSGPSHFKIRILWKRERGRGEGEGLKASYHTCRCNFIMAQIKQHQEDYCFHCHWLGFGKCGWTFFPVCLPQKKASAATNVNWNKTGVSASFIFDW